MSYFSPIRLKITISIYLILPHKGKNGLQRFKEGKSLLTGNGIGIFFALTSVNSEIRKDGKIQKNRMYNLKIGD